MNRSPHLGAAAYGLDALEGIERLGFEGHLDGCAECAGDVLDVRDASELLSVGVTLDPPPSLRARVLAAAGIVEVAGPGRPNGR